MKSLSAHFDELVDLPDGQRAEWLDALAVESPERAAALREMLAADEAAGPGTGSAQIPLVGAALIGTLFEGRQAAFDALGFRPLRLLGRGGMGEVWLVERAIAGRSQQLALKLLQPPPGEAAADVWLQRFRTEQQILLELNHPGIARLIDAGETAGQPWIAMEFVDGPDLVRWCDQQGLDIAARLRLFQRVCAAVQYAHDSLIVHRDLKPANVLVGADGQPKLLDFGIAKLLGPDSTQAETRTAQQLFSLYGVAPEQLLGQRATVGTDVYALGALLYELLCGKPALALDDISGFAAIEARVLHASPMAPSAVARLLPASSASHRGGHTPGSLARELRGDADRIVLHALRKQPGERYASARELSADIDRLLRQEAVHATGQSRAYRTAKFLRRHRFAAALATLALGVLLAFIWQLKRERDAAERARVEAERSRDSAERVSQFMVRIFESGDPTRSGDANISAARLLEQAFGQLRSEKLDPEINAAVMMAMARAAAGISDFDTHRKALQALVDGDPHLTVEQRVDRDLMRIQDLATQNERTRAKSLLTDVLNAGGQRFTARQRERLDLLTAQFAERAGNYEQALDIFTRRPEWSPEFRIKAVQEHALVLDRLKRTGDAAAVLSAAIDKVGELPAPEIAKADFMVSRAQYLAKLNRVAEADQLAKDGLALMLSRLDKTHTRVITARNRTAEMHRIAGRFHLAATVLHEVISDLEVAQQKRPVVEGAKYNFIINVSEDVCAADDYMAKAVVYGTQALSEPWTMVREIPYLEVRIRLALLRIAFLRHEVQESRRQLAAIEAARKAWENDATRVAQVEAWRLVLSAAPGPQSESQQNAFLQSGVKDEILSLALQNRAHRRIDHCQQP